MGKRAAFLRNYLPIFVMGAGILIIGAMLLTGRLTISQTLTYLQDRPAICAAALLVLYLVKGFSVVIPYSVLAAAAGLVFKLPLAIALNLIGTVLCLTVSYAIGFYTKTTSLEQKLERHPKIKHYFENARTFGFGFSYTLHVLGLSTEVLGVLFGLMRLAYWKYVLSSLLAISPGMVCCTIVGGELSFRSPVFWGILACDLVIISICALTTRRKLAARNEKE